MAKKDKDGKTITRWYSFSLPPAVAEKVREAASANGSGGKNFVRWLVIKAMVERFPELAPTGKEESPVEEAA